MKEYILRRLAIATPILVVISFLVFALMTMAPGDFLDTARQQRDISAETIAALEKQYGLDKPWYIQFGRWLSNVAKGDFGYSWTYKVPVGELLKQRVPATVALSLASLLVAWLIAIPLGVLAAIKKDSLFDRASALFAYASISIPEFFLGLLALFFAATTGAFPVGGLTSVTADFGPFPQRAADYLWHLALPAAVLGLGGVAGTLRIMRANFLDVIAADFVRTARAKGLGEATVMFKHVLRNAINPLVTSLGFAFSGLLSGALLIENIFNYPGLGQLTYNAYLRQDQQLVMASVVLGAAMLILGNLLADILLARCDPRIRLDARSAAPAAPGASAWLTYGIAAAAVLALTCAVSWLPWDHKGFWRGLKTGGGVALALGGLFVVRTGWPVIRRIVPQLVRRPIGAAALGILALFYTVAAFAPFVAPYTFTEQNLDRTFHPPSPWLWKDGGLHVQTLHNTDRSTARYEPVPGDTLPVRWFAKGDPYKLFGLIPAERHLFLVDKPGAVYLLGSDATGRCVFSRLVYGSRVSLTLGLIGVTITMTLGFLVGGLSGYIGGAFDNVMMRAVEVLMSIPGLYLLIALRAALASHFESDEMFVLIVVILALVGWTGTARVIRGMTLSIRQRPFVAAAEALGQSRMKILLNHVLPNLASYLVVSATLSIPGYILGEAALSFLGLGIMEPSASWGLMLSSAQQIKVIMLNLTWLFAPGVAIFLVVIAFNLLGDQLRDIIDPKFRIGGKP